MRWLVLVVVGVVLASAPREACADDAVALLPLDADARLEIYGQPVASEVARALVAGGIDVVVVGPKMAVPARARLIVDGKISAGKGDTVVLSLRIRERDTGTVLDTLSSNAAALTSIDQAAADLSARVLPTVRGRLASRATPPAKPPTAVDPPPAHVAPAAPAPPPPFAVTITADDAATGEALRAALGEPTAAWLRAHHREPRAAKPGDTAASVQLAIADYRVEPGHVALATARVRVRIADAAQAVVFERVIVTDTIVGDRDQPAAQLAARVAREVLAILSPHALRALPELAAP